MQIHPNTIPGPMPTPAGTLARAAGFALGLAAVACGYPAMLIAAVAVGLYAGQILDFQGKGE